MPKKNKYSIEETLLMMSIMLFIGSIYWRTLYKTNVVSSIYVSDLQTMEVVDHSPKQLFDEEMSKNLETTQKVNLEEVLEEETIEDFLGKFYREYAEAIKERETGFLRRYVVEEAVEEISQSYYEWYIRDKNIEEVNLEVSIQKIGSREAETQFIVTEEVEILNQQHTEEGIQEQVYKVITKWEMRIKLENSSYKIISKVLQESIVAYLNLEGEWIAY